jgi:hypothetical protein
MLMIRDRECGGVGMEYHYSQKQIWDQPGSILDYVQQVNICNQNNLLHMEELLSLIELTGMEEVEVHMQRAIADLQNSQLWVKMALAALEDRR